VTNFSRIDLKRSWNKIARDYKRRYNISSDVVHFGPLCPGEDRLRLLGDIRGQRVLDLGCGAGQNAVAPGRLGARVVGVDFSEGQVANARLLAEKSGVEATSLAADIASLPALKDRSFDLAVSACEIAFVKKIGPVLNVAGRVLKRGGKFVLSDMHPLQNILDQIPRGMSFGRAYPFEQIHLKWRWEFKNRKKKPAGAGFEHYVRSVPQYCNALIDSGYVIRRILEPAPTLDTPHLDFSREIMKEYKYIARHLPITFIIVAEKEKRR
jgi:ubiquinone/menaquinone biosynthesis C-methylase UbiE